MTREKNKREIEVNLDFRSLGVFNPASIHEGSWSCTVFLRWIYMKKEYSIIHEWSWLCIYIYWTAILAFTPYAVKGLSGGNNSVNSIDCQTPLRSQIIVEFYIHYRTTSVISTKALRYNLLVSIYTMFAVQCRFLLLVFTTASFKYLLSSSSSGNDSLVHHRGLCSVLLF